MIAAPQGFLDLFAAAGSSDYCGISWSDLCNLE
jgi:hypothetical protein